MKVEMNHYDKNGWKKNLNPALDSRNTVSFVFFGPDCSVKQVMDDLKRVLPNAIILGCSGSGEISNSVVVDETIVVTTVQFEKTNLESHFKQLKESKDSYKVGKELSSQFTKEGLKAVFILSEGIHVNGTDLMAGIRSELNPNVIISGGLAGDGTAFSKTRLIYGQQESTGLVIGLGFYGDHIKAAACAGAGWLPFGPERLITRSSNNILYELDGKPALALYKEFLGEGAKGLPASALNFPLFLGAERSIVRTILGVDESQNSMTFAGDIPTGEVVRLMRTSEMGLVSAAEACVERCMKLLSPNQPVLSLMVSCVGRRLVLGTSVDDEVEAVSSLLPKGSIQTGFYSYGELAPGTQGYCDLHNQTATLTLLQESI